MDKNVRNKLEEYLIELAEAARANRNDKGIVADTLFEATGAIAILSKLYPEDEHELDEMYDDWETVIMETTDYWK